MLKRDAWPGLSLPAVWLRPGAFNISDYKKNANEDVFNHNDGRR
jgi:hypothetical protein